MMSPAKTTDTLARTGATSAAMSGRAASRLMRSTQQMIQTATAGSNRWATGRSSWRKGCWTRLPVGPQTGVAFLQGQPGGRT
jgi:hypothetical protein